MFGEQIVKGGIGTRTILKIAKLFPFISVHDIMETEIGSGH